MLGWLILILVMLRFADVAMTLFAVHTGYAESNKLMVWAISRGWPAALEVAATNVALTAFLVWINHRYPWEAFVAAFLFICVALVPIVHNIKVWVKHK